MNMIYNAMLNVLKSPETSYYQAHNVLAVRRIFHIHLTGFPDLNKENLDNFYQCR